MKYVLGLDLGYNSIGWAMIELDENDNPKKLINTGVRLFDPSVEDMEKDGKGKTKNVTRREARLRRRQLFRKTKRLEKLLNFFIENNFFDDQKDKIFDSFERNEFLSKLDKEMLNPYILRKKGLDEKLELKELARIFYHIAQHRGFKTTKRELAKIEEGGEKKKESGVIQSEINSLAEQIKQSGCRTLGEYFSMLFEKGERIRGKHTSRKMYEEEFEQIFKKQKEFYPEILTDEFKKKLYKLIFFQRELKSQKDKVGECILEKGKKRAPLALLDSQRFRYMCKVNNLKLIDKDTGEITELTKEEKQKIFNELENNEKLAFDKIKKILGIKDKERFIFNIEKGGEKHITGNRTNVKMKKVFDDWDNFEEEKKNSLINEIRTIVKIEALERRGLKLGLSPEQAKKFSQVVFEDGYLSYSKKAIEKLLPFLKEGYKESDAIKKVYSVELDNPMHEEFDFLPEIEDVVQVRNPLVERTLSETRYLVNFLIKKYGKPETIKIELARELKLSNKQKEQKIKENRENRKKREDAIEKIKHDLNISEPTEDQILRYLLAEECSWHCPYTGKSININDLLGPHPLFDIEHIIPFDRSLDNSFLNKTLCYSEENRNVKHNKTPYEAYFGTDKWEAIIERVKKFNGNARLEKLRRFQMTPEQVEQHFENFSSQYLNDTRYASKEAKKYLGLLYGGIKDDGMDKNKIRRVIATSGKVTATLRNALGLNTILNEENFKIRDDHRQHAIDAITIALTDNSTIKKISDAAKREKSYSKLFKNYPLPWENFRNEVEEKITNLLVSRKVNKKVSGQIHDETYYKKPFEENGQSYTHKRINLENLSEKDIENIVDPKIKEIIKSNLNGEDPKIKFKDPKNHPYIEEKDGKKVQIHKVTIKIKFETYNEIGPEKAKRYVQSADSHHIEIFEDLTTGKWDGYVVSLLEAYKRKQQNLPIINRNFGENKKFLFSLAKGEVIELDTENGERELFVVRVISASNNQITFVKLNDARLTTEIFKNKKGLTAFPSSLQERNCKKVVINILGEKHYAND
ncbi:MAG: type II CRISPR RNA-guided endonuclease Cas9 [candidate division WOR-3 bacterium]